MSHTCGYTRATCCEKMFEHRTGEVLCICQGSLHTHRKREVIHRQPANSKHFRAQEMRMACECMQTSEQCWSWEKLKFKPACSVLPNGQVSVGPFQLLKRDTWAIGCSLPLLSLHISSATVSGSFLQGKSQERSVMLRHSGQWM